MPASSPSASPPRATSRAPNCTTPSRDRTALVLNYLSFACLVAILVLMVFKPGAG